MSPAARKLLLTVHVATSVGWLGAAMAYLPLDVATQASPDAETVRSAYVAMQLIARWALVPLAVSTLATGIAIALATPWGLFRHYWVLLSLILTALAAVVLFVEARVIDALAAAARNPGTSDAQLHALPGTLPHSVGGTLVLLFVLALNVYKPRGLTRYGWRKRREGDPE